MSYTRSTCKIIITIKRLCQVNYAKLLLADLTQKSFRLASDQFLSVFGRSICLVNTKEDKTIFFSETTRPRPMILVVGIT